MDKHDDKRYDLIVVGGGRAGFAAAIQAHELGKAVLKTTKRRYDHA